VTITAITFFVSSIKKKKMGDVSKLAIIALFRTTIIKEKKK
jgi:hypothetical protein